MYAIYRSRPLRRAWLLAAVLGLLAPAIVCRADDESLVGVSGTIEALSPNPSIRMVEESVHIGDPTDPHGVARFVFKNEGPATDVLIGFPETGDQIAPGKPASPGLIHFRSFVDGKRVKVHRHMAHHEPALFSDFDYVAWYMKRVHFAARQAHVIVDEYDGGGGSQGSGLKYFIYVLKSGATWKGPIGRAVITANIGKIANCSPVSITPVCYTRRGSLITWDLRNFKPTQNIEIDWFDGFLNISINGCYPYLGYTRQAAKVTADDFSNDDSAYPQYLPVKRHGDIWLPAQVAASWLGANFSVVKPGRLLRISYRNRWVDIRIGRRTLIRSDGKRFLMPDPAAYMRDPWPPHTNVLAMVDLTPLVYAFGGTACFDAAGNHLSVSVPNRNAPIRPSYP